MLLFLTVELVVGSGIAGLVGMAAGTVTTRFLRLRLTGDLGGVVGAVLVLDRVGVVSYCDTTPA